jgi:hypothetical protein
MKRVVSFVTGFAAGWIVRSTVDSSREAVVRMIALGLDSAQRARRLVALEREWLDDLVAEAKARNPWRAATLTADGSPPSSNGGMRRAAGHAE